MGRKEARRFWKKGGGRTGQRSRTPLSYKGFDEYIREIWTIEKDAKRLLWGGGVGGILNSISPGEGGESLVKCYYTFYDVVWKK